MKTCAYFGKKLQHLRGCPWMSSRSPVTRFYRYLVFGMNPFWIQLCYYMYFSFWGFLVLKGLKPRSDSFRPKNLDMFFTSVSAVTVSSMSTVEMEVFSNSQLVIMTLLMLFGGEVVTSMLGLQFMKYKLKNDRNTDNKVDSFNITTTPTNVIHQIELGMVRSPDFAIVKSNYDIDSIASEGNLKYNSVRLLGYIVLGYLLVLVGCGSALIMVYLTLVTSASDVLKNKGIQIQIFSVFTIVSTFNNCGFVPTNENMVAFKNNPGILLLLIPQILLGNTLYPSCLRVLIWLLGKLMKRDECRYILENTIEIGYTHLLPSLHSVCLVVTMLAFILVQFVLFCCMEWNSRVLDGMNSYEKIVGALFMTVNSRHAGESIVDLSSVSSAVLVMFVMMMYLPPYTSFLPIQEYGESSRSYDKRKRQRGRLLDDLIFSQLTYLVIFTILICITERKKMKEDPLNFTLLNIVIEVVSAYGNVGFTAGYSCKRQINHDGYCKDTWFGFSGRWSNQGKVILILVMFFGRMKKFNMEGGKAWKLL